MVEDGWMGATRERECVVGVVEDGCMGATRERECVVGVVDVVESLSPPSLPLLPSLSHFLSVGGMGG